MPFDFRIGPVELYNLSDDPSEEHNLAATNSARVETLRKRVDAWWDARNRGRLRPDRIPVSQSFLTSQRCSRRRTF